VSSTRHDAVVHSNKTPPPSQDPSQHDLHLQSRRCGVFCASALARSHQKNRQFDDALLRHQYRTVQAISHLGSTARFNQDIRHVIIDMYLRRRVATRGRGCRDASIFDETHRHAVATRRPPQPPLTHQSPHRLGAGARERRRGKVDAEVEGVTRRCQGGGGATALLGWEVGSGSAAVLARCRWRGGMTIAVGVPLRCWDSGGTVGA
jgi:hypothetical protein